MYYKICLPRKISWITFSVNGSCTTRVYVQVTEPSNGRRIYDCCPIRATEEEV